MKLDIIQKEESNQTSHSTKTDVVIALNQETANGFILDGDKLMWHKDRVEGWQKGERIAPITIDMALTRACNMRCSFCYAML